MGTVKLAVAAIALIVGTVASAFAATAANTVPLPRPSPLRAAAPATLRTSPPPPAAASTDTRSVLERVNATLSNIQTLVGDFVQIGPDGRRSEGQFYVQKPGKVRFEYNPPSPIDVVADGQTVVVRDRVLGTQNPFPLSQTPLRLLLSNRVDLSTDAHLVSVTADDSLITVVIEENQVLIGTHRLKMMFGAKDYQLRQWVVTDPQGFSTSVSIYNLDSTKKLDPDLFKITYERNLQ